MKLLIVDDEEYTRTGLESALDWASLGISEVRSGSDGRMGLQLAETFMPDILLTDVRMPFIMGIEMAQHIREFLPMCQVIFMSGYSDKEYLLGAIKLSSVAYVEKPLDLAELSRAISQAVDNSKAEHLKIELIKHFDLSFSRELALDLTHNNNDEHLLLQRWKTLNAPDGDYLSLVAYSRRLCNRDLDSIAEIMNQNKVWHICAIYQEGYIAIHTLGIEKTLLHHICSELTCLHVDMIIGVGIAVEHHLLLKDSFKCALDSLERFFYHPQQKVFHPNCSQALHFTAPDLRSFVELIYDDPKKANDVLLSVVQKLRDCDGTSVSAVRHAVYWICKEAFTYTPQLLEHIVADCSNNSLESLIDAAVNIDDLCRLLQMCIMVLAPQGTSQMETSIVRCTQRYIEQHFYDVELTIKHISSKIYLSPAYLCVVFKNETGDTIKSYITKCRMDRAKQLLRTTRLHVQEIAEMSGFSNGNYFAKSFRRDMGMSPQDYRGRFDLL